MNIAQQTILNQIKIQEIINIIKTKIDPEQIILFGSRTGNHFHENSDYDLCIIKKNVVHRRKLAQEIYKLLYGTGISADIIVETPEKFLEHKENPYLIHKQIEDSGQLLYEKC